MYFYTLNNGFKIFKLSIYQYININSPSCDTKENVDIKVIMYSVNYRDA